MFSIRKKAVIIMAVCLLLVLALGYAVTQLMLMPSYLTLENQTARENITRALNALQDDVDNLDRYVTIYAWSDDACNFIRTLNQNYILSNLKETDFMQGRINAAVFTDAQDQVIYSREYQLEYGEEIPLPGIFNASLLRVSIQSYAISLGTRMNESLEGGVKGLVILPEGPMLISVRHILPSNRTGPVQGNLFMGRYLDSLEITRLEQITHVSLTLHRPDDPAIPSNVFKSGGRGDGQSILTVPVNSNTMDAYTVLNDVSGQPILVLQAEMPRDIYNAGVTTVDYVMASLLLAGVLFSGVSIAMSEKTIFSRMSRLERDVSHIGAEGRFSSRLSVAGGDEVTRLSISVNKMLESLEASQKRMQGVQSLAAIGQASAMVGHDLRNPLQTMTTTLYLVKELLSSSRFEDKSQVLQLLAMLDGEVYYMDKIVSDLQDYARPVDDEPIETNVHDLIEEALASVILPGNVVVSNLIDGDPPKATVSPVLLKRVLVNLILNAIQAMPNGGNLTITSNKVQDWALIKVKDTGIGIPSENMPKIFEPFFTTKAQGQGLGLAVCKRLIEGQGGAITADSVEGKGAIFALKLRVFESARLVNSPPTPTTA